MKDARRTPITRLFKKEGDEFCYVYDFGDSWVHNISLIKLSPNDQGVVNPYCAGGSGACPPEDVGGIGGYQRMLEIIKTPDHPEYRELMEWLELAPGEKWDAELYSQREINRRMAMIASDV